MKIPILKALSESVFKIGQFHFVHDGEAVFEKLKDEEEKL